MAYWFVFNSIKADRIKDVGQIAEARYEVIHKRLLEDQERSKILLDTLIAVCRYSDGGINACAKAKLEQFSAINHVAGISLHTGIEGDLTIGDDAITLDSFNKPFQSGQLAATSTSKLNRAALFSLIAVDSTSGFSLVTTYAGQNLQDIFVTSSVLGQSGEIFLADNQGFFITKARYPSQQGHSKPISALPMQHCLHGESGEMLALDYRNVAIIHGFRFVPEIGGGCIMAHIDQQEAFAPLLRLLIGLNIVVFLLIASAWIIARIIGRGISKPIIALADMTQALSQGDFTPQVFSTGYQEIAQLLQLFNHMAKQLNDTLSQLKASEHELEKKVVERTTELQERHRKYYSVIQTTSEGFWRLDQDGYLLEVNPAYADLSGYSEQELLGMQITDLDANEAPDETLTHIQKIIQQGSDTFETKHRRKDGSLWDVEVNASFINENGGYFIGFFRDITERKQAQTKLQASEERFRRIANSSPIIIWITDAVGNPIFVNQSWLDFTGIGSLQTLSYEEWISTIHPDDRKAAYATYYQNTDNHTAISSEYRLRNADGLWHWVFDKGMPFYDENNLFCGYIGSAIDITERKRVEDEILSTKNELQATMNAIPDLLFDVDSEGRYYNYHAPHMELLAAPPEQLLGKTVTELLPADVAAICLAALEEARQQGRSIGKQYKLTLPQGDCWFELSVAIKPIHDNKQLPRFIVLSRDITERKKAELALRESEELLRAITNNAGTVIFLKDQTGKYLYVNQQYEKLFHVSNAAMQGKTDYDLFPKNMADIFTMNDQKVIQSGQLLEVEEKVPQDDGCHTYIAIKFPIRNITGKIYAVCGIATDITERKRIELDLHIAAVAFQSQEPIVITDVNSVILRINKAFTKSTGYTEEEAVGQKISLLKSGHHDADFYATMWESIINTGSWQGEIWDRRKNGEIYPKWLSITAVKGHDGIITHYVGTHTDITERKSAEEQIKQLAFYDPLTQLPNRRLLQERLKHSIDVKQRNGKQLALLMLDLDRFKAVNDSLGHLAGDELLQQVAGRITARLRNVDTVARLGGDEFVILLEEIAHADDAARIAEEIVMDLSQPFKLTQNDEVRIGASIGISLYPEHGDQLEILMDRADAALYQAKAQGRNCFAYFSEELTIVTKERIALEMRLRHAIEQQELRVFFQAQVDIPSGRIVGAEALVRWQDPNDGLLLPAHFIPIAEETGLILEVGDWILRETCKQGQQWLAAGLPPITLAVNISSQQFRRSDICTLVANILTETGFPPEQLELEITESGLMENQDNAIAILNNFRHQGIHLAIDNFGAGYSSLACLKHFPLDVLKIGKRFIDETPYHQDAMEITATIIAMGHILGFKVLAEGVETVAQLAFLQEKGCDRYQGYLKSKPIPAREFAELLRDQQKQIQLQQF